MLSKKFEQGQVYRCATFLLITLCKGWGTEEKTDVDLKAKCSPILV